MKIVGRPKTYQNPNQGHPFITQLSAKNTYRIQIYMIDKQEAHPYKNNKSKSLLKTINSRALEIKIILNESQRLEIIDKLISFFNLELILEPKSSQLSPGNFIKYNHICNEYSVLPTNDLVENLTLLLNLYKKEKNILFINIILFIIDFYFKDKNLFKNDNIFEIKNYIFDNVNKFMMYNINQNSLINAVKEKLNYE